jgi:predicted RND superfamily exporter protein
MAIAMHQKKSRLIIFIIGLITLLSLIPLRSLRFEFNIEKLFPHGDPDLVFFQQFQQQFHSEKEDEFILIGLKNEKGIFDKSFLTKTDSLTRFVTRMEHVIKVYSLTSANVLYFLNEEINARPLVHTMQPEFYAADSAYLFNSKEYRDLLVSKDGKSIVIAAFNKQFLTDGQKDSLLGQINYVIKQLGFDESHVTAKIRIERIYVKEIEKNLKKYLIISLSLISLVLFILFRSVKNIIIPLVIVLLSIVWTMSLIALTGHPLDIISSLIPPILAAICMSDIIHISTHYIEKLRSGLSKKEALNKTYKEIGMATFYTCCTVAAGFFTLAITDITPIRNFGIFTGAGIFIGFGITLFSLWAYYTISPVPDVVYEQSNEHRWNSFLGGSYKKIIKNKFTVLGVFALLTIASGFWVNKIEINSSLLQEIPKKNPVLKDFSFIEKNFSGTRPFELSLTLKDTSRSFFEIPVMKQVEVIETFLKDSCGVGTVVSPLSLFKGANKAFHNDENSQFRLPETVQQVERFYQAIAQTQYAYELEHFMSGDGKWIRISGRLPNLTIKEFKAIENKFDSFFNRNNLASAFTYHHTGSAVLLDKVTYSLTGNLFTGIAIDAVLISLIAFLLLKNWRAIFIVLIPNVIPLLMMGAMMGLLGINLKADTSVIFAIAFGIAVDDSIHFMSRLRLELSKGLSLPYAIKRTYISTGKAIIITCLVLLSGFMTLLSSGFGGVFYIGLLISTCIIMALIMELTVTPILLLLFFSNKNSLPGKKTNSKAS